MRVVKILAGLAVLVGAIGVFLSAVTPNTYAVFKVTRDYE